MAPVYGAASRRRAGGPAAEQPVAQTDQRLGGSRIDLEGRTAITLGHAAIDDQHWDASTRRMVEEPNSRVDDEGRSGDQERICLLYQRTGLDKFLPRHELSEEDD